MSDLNDPRVFFAAERTLLAWNRTSLTLMAFGFVIQRFGLFMQMLGTVDPDSVEFAVSFWIGLGFVFLGALTSLIGIIQYRTSLRVLKPVEVPTGYWVNAGVGLNLAVSLLGLCLTVYLFLGPML